MFYTFGESKSQKIRRGIPLHRNVHLTVFLYHLVYLSIQKPETRVRHCLSPCVLNN